MSLVALEIASDDLWKGAARVLPFVPFVPLGVYVAYVANPETASFGDLVAFYRSAAALWLAVLAVTLGGLWEVVYVGPARRAARMEAARATAARRSAKR